MADYVERYWSVNWSTNKPAQRSVLSHPTFHLAVTTTTDGVRPACQAVVHGVVSATFSAEIRGRGRVVGAKFRPGGFAALTGRNASAFTDRTVPLQDLVPCQAVDELIAQVSAAPDDPDAGVSALENLITGMLPPRRSPAYQTLLAVITDMLDDHCLGRVEDVAARHHLSVRALQRLFRRLVGVGPKWVLRRYRLHDAIAAIDSDPGVISDLAGLAAALGWSDQSHFNRDFSAAVGVSPQAYAARPR